GLSKTDPIPRGVTKKALLLLVIICMCYQIDLTTGKAAPPEKKEHDDLH
ncbi:hypothetical protein LCGC14_3027500, partial [marine sediment metagenome]